MNPQDKSKYGFTQFQGCHHQIQKKTHYAPFGVVGYVFRVALIFVSIVGWFFGTWFLPMVFYFG
jgi:hypothetical protein